MDDLKKLIQEAENSMQNSKNEISAAFDDDRRLNEESLSMGEDIIGATEQLFSELKIRNDLLQLEFEGL